MKLSYLLCALLMSIGSLKTGDYQDLLNSKAWTNQSRSRQNIFYTFGGDKIENNTTTPVKFLQLPYSTCHTIKQEPITLNKTFINEGNVIAHKEVKQEQTPIIIHELTKFGLACRIAKQIGGIGLMIAGSTLGGYLADQATNNGYYANVRFIFLGCLGGSWLTYESLPGISRKIS